MKKSKGFTLVEIIVSLAIFSIVAVVALGALVKIVSANKKAQTLQSAITNLNYAMESISREMRVGKIYNCDTSEPNYTSLSKDMDGCNELIEEGEVGFIAFKSPKLAPKSSGGLCNLVISYRFSNDGISKWKQDNCDDVPGGANDYSPILDSNVTVDGVYLNVSNNRVPLATIRISGHTGVKEREKTYFDLQTSISPRLGDE